MVFCSARFDAIYCLSFAMPRLHICGTCDTLEAYRIMRQLNQNLVAKCRLTVVIVQYQASQLKAVPQKVDASDLIVCQPEKPQLIHTCQQRRTSLILHGCWLLAVGCWLLAVGCWLLSVGCWLLELSQPYILDPRRMIGFCHC